MRSPADFAGAYVVERAASEALEGSAGGQILRQICRPNQWLFADRVKDEESALSKLQLGPVPALAEMQDVYAATIVVPTRAEVQSAKDAVAAHFDHVEEVPRELRDPRRFAYDDLHLVTSLGSNAPGDLHGIADRKFEIQIHTGLQYAWWRASHKVLYKGTQSWALLRVASQVRASLELLDGVLADLTGAAERLGVVDTDDDKAFERVVAWLAWWPERSRPLDVVRFFQQVSELARTQRIGLDAIEQLLQADPGRALIADENVTPVQAVIGAIILDKGAQFTDRLRAGRYVLVTKELEAACPEAANIPTHRRVQL